MRVLIDTNVFLSAMLNPKGIPYGACIKAVTDPNLGMTSEWNVWELRKILSRKFPSMLDDLETFLFITLGGLEILPVPEAKVDGEERIRDEKDRCILRTAIFYKADAILSGDKDFLELGLEYPKCMSPTEFFWNGTREN